MLSAILSQPQCINKNGTFLDASRQLAIAITVNLKLQLSHNKCQKYSLKLEIQGKYVAVNAFIQKNKMQQLASRAQSILKKLC